MKRLIVAVLVAAGLGGCAIVPVGPYYSGERYDSRAYVAPPVVVVEPIVPFWVHRRGSRHGGRHWR